MNTTLLSVDKDPMGTAIADYYKRHKAERLRVFSSQFDEDEIPVKELFRMEKQMPLLYNPQIQISAESETKRSIFRKRDKTKRSKKESAQHSKSRNKSFVMTSVSAL